MKIVVIGGTGLIGKKLVQNLQELGHEVLAASPSRGVNAVTGEGLKQALSGAQVVVDVSNSPSFADEPVMQFFETSTTNLLAAEAAAGVKHHIALSVVGTDRNPDIGYFRAKLVQEKLIQAGPIPYTIVRATQFFEFVGGIAESVFDGQTVRASTALLQPIFSGDVSQTLTDIALATPQNKILELAGPEKIAMDELVRRLFDATHDQRPVTPDTSGFYFGAVIDDTSLTPGANPLLGQMKFDDWLHQTVVPV